MCFKSFYNLKIMAFKGFFKFIIKISVMLANNKIKVQTDFVVIDTPIQADSRQYMGLINNKKLKYIKNVSNLDTFTVISSFPNIVKKLYLKYAQIRKYLIL